MFFRGFGMFNCTFVFLCIRPYPLNPAEQKSESFSVRLTKETSHCNSHFRKFSFSSNNNEFCHRPLRLTGGLKNESINERLDLQTILVFILPNRDNFTFSRKFAQSIYIKTSIIFKILIKRLASSVL